MNSMQHICLIKLYTPSFNKLLLFAMEDSEVFTSTFYLSWIDTMPKNIWKVMRTKILNYSYKNGSFWWSLMLKCFFLCHNSCATGHWTQIYLWCVQGIHKGRAMPTRKNVCYCSQKQVAGLNTGFLLHKQYFSWRTQCCSYSVIRFFVYISLFEAN